MMQQNFIIVKDIVAKEYTTLEKSRKTKLLGSTIYSILKGKPVQFATRLSRSPFGKTVNLITLRDMLHLFASFQLRKIDMVYSIPHAYPNRGEQRTTRANFVNLSPNPVDPIKH
ncbi:hypothetical protein L2E82_28973 [Cichorium intybus]|uniref:Uncharacterized protein n=1 Tax=Cichorium intybus TaxID=13427 RepID=A0ACB9CXA4_CICIN|nr:hypothetical protein L2E82_28973 [Cichorium intybus]